MDGFEPPIFCWDYRHEPSHHFMQGCQWILSCVHTRPRFYWTELCPHRKLIFMDFPFLTPSISSGHPCLSNESSTCVRSETLSLGHPTNICTLHYAGLPNVGTFYFTVPAPTLFFNTTQKRPSRTKLRCSRWWAWVVWKSTSWLKFKLCQQSKLLFPSNNRHS